MKILKVLIICVMTLALLLCVCGEAGDTSAIQKEIIQPTHDPFVEETFPATEPILKVVKVKTERLTLESFAQNKMNDLVKTGYWSHTNSNGCDFNCRASSYLKDYAWIGENLYRGVCDLDNAYRLWRESPTHLYILNHEYTKQVILMQEYSTGKCYVILERAISIGY